MALSPPANGQYYAVGEAPTISLRLKNACGSVLTPSDLGSAEFYLSGPRGALKTQTACGLLNCTTDRAAPDHHRVNLIAPNYADPAKGGLSTAEDGTLAYQLQPITTEPAGTYTLMLLAESLDHVDQVDVTNEMQIGTTDREELASGPVATAACLNCHKSPMNGQVYMHHVHPGFDPFGNYAIDNQPIASCVGCHNVDGYSANTLVRKVHGLHRGEHQLGPGVAHPDYGVPSDPTLAAYTNVAYPDLPDGEKDCASCHADDRWKTRPSRLACGTCHDNVFFDTGVLNPPRSFSKACALDDDCLSTGSFLTCDTSTHTCQRASHPVQTDDSQCATCHPADSGPPPTAPVAVVHTVQQRTQDPGLQILHPTLSGETGTNGRFKIGDTPSLSFGVSNASGAVTDLLTNSAYSVNLVVAGPTSAPQQLYSNALDLKKLGMTFDGTNYQFAFPGPLPANAVPPLNNPAAATAPATAGTYTAWLYVIKAQPSSTVRNTADEFLYFQIDTLDSVMPRQVISDAACNACHVNVQAHGGGRQNAQGCHTCHNAGALDRGVGAKGVACSVDSDCPGHTAGWESCQDTKPPVGNDTCVVTVDPTPNQSIDFRQLVHRIHFGRKLGGYAERDFLPPSTGKFEVLGFNNSINDFSDVLFPEDIRSCKSCHVDTAATCSSTAPCGYGQTCRGGSCINTAWLAPSSVACLSCHDEADTYGHAALNTWNGPTGPVETCSVCHGEGAQFSVDKVHSIAKPYVPPYPRE